jgi:hypothetical protein
MSNPIFCSLRRMYINKGGYDRHGKYWGIGSPLYEYYFELSGETFDGTLRAVNRETAKGLVQKHYPTVTFRFKYNAKDKM